MKRKNKNSTSRAYERRRQARIRAGQPEPNPPRKPADIKVDQHQAAWMAMLMRAIRGKTVCLTPLLVTLLTSCTPY